ncbi:MAG: vitamin K epoxide reductase family protein [Solirubrobacteraceae bacterium]
MRPSLGGTLPPLPPAVVEARRAARASVTWRDGDTPRLERRRRIIARYLLASVPMAVVALYQTGILEDLPDLPLDRFEAREVDAAAEAYQLLEMPDALLALLSNATTMALAGLTFSDDGPAWPRRLLGLKAGVDTAYALKLTGDQLFVHRKLCSWCLASTAATLAALPHALREART